MLTSRTCLLGAFADAQNLSKTFGIDGAIADGWQRGPRHFRITLACLRCPPEQTALARPEAGLLPTSSSNYASR